MASVARSRADGEGQMVPRTPARGTPGADAYRFCVNWNGMLEPLELPKGCTVAQLLSVLKSGKYAKDAHKFVVFKGLLLTNPTTLAQAGIRDGSVLHLLLNDDPYRGKPLFIKTLSGRTRSVSCGPDFYIEDVKEELSYYPGELTAEKTRLVYAGRLLQNQHTLREYNIQKPSLLLALGPPAEGRQLSTFVAGVYPRRDQCQVKSNAQLSVRFHTAEVNDTHFFGQLLGAPDLSSLSNKDIKVYKCGATDVQIAGELMVDLDDNSFTWVPLRPLQAATRYTVYLNKQEPAPAADAQSGITAPSFGLPLPGATKGSQSAQSSFRHSRASEPVQGEVTWDFFTEGYEPMRITAIYPRPHTRVRHDTVVIILGFSGSVHPGCNPNRWVSLRGHDLSPPLWDASSKSLIYKLAQPLRPNEIVRVSVREHLIRGSKGESVYPIQQDGMIRTSAFRWKFYTAEESKYELQNAFSCGVSPVLERLRNGQIPTLAAQSQVLLDMVGEQNRLSQSVGLALDPDTGRMISRSVMQSEETQHALGWHMLDPTGLLGIGVRNMSQNMVEAPEPAAAHKDALRDETPPMPSTPKMAVNSPPPAMYSAVPRKSNNATEWIF